MVIPGSLLPIGSIPVSALGARILKNAKIKQIFWCKRYDEEE